MGYWMLSAICTKNCLPSAVNLSRMCKIFTGPTLQANFTQRLSLTMQVYIPFLWCFYLQSPTNMKMWRSTHLPFSDYLPCSLKLLKSESVFKGRLSVQSACGSDSNRNVITAIRGFHFYVYYIMNIDWISVNKDFEILFCPPNFEIPKHSENFRQYVSRCMHLKSGFSPK